MQLDDTHVQIERQRFQWVAEYALWVQKKKKRNSCRGIKVCDWLHLPGRAGGVSLWMFRGGTAKLMQHCLAPAGEQTKEVER